MTRLSTESLPSCLHHKATPLGVQSDLCHPIPRELIALPVRDYKKRQRDPSVAEGMVKDRNEEVASATLGFWSENVWAGAQPSREPVSVVGGLSRQYVKWYRRPGCGLSGQWNTSFYSSQDPGYWCPTLRALI